ncbi:MAG: hypothetical protein HYS17_03075 [Micavibrio aeruginosavorus]|uniref:Lipoprotein n=1 Tax=Micavibrio aeruginosavorus TaxID=349221 RepID=A0A7T5UI97_9BACT|nr:MAG: hypothetical protein HYS17_03075 [Micavibrio aeruginosavorus]
MIFVSKKSLKKVLCTLALIIAIGFVTACRQAEAEEYKYVTPGFVDAIKGVNKDAFFSLSEAEILEKAKSSVVRSEIEQKKADMSVLSSHYRTIGEGLCEPITPTYHGLMQKKYKNSDAYGIDSEITKIMREAGAYTLPILVKKGWFKASYSVMPGGALNAEGFKAAYKNDAGPIVRSFGDIEIQDERTVIISGRADENGGNYKYFQAFNTFARDHFFQIKDVSYEFDFVRPYLFVLDRDATNINQGAVYYYVLLPYSVSGNDQHTVVTYQYKEDNKLRCYAGSIANVWATGTRNLAGRFETHAASPLTEPEPLTIPHHPEYGATQYPDEKGRLIKNTSYKVEASEMAEPSLRCWLNSMSFLSDIKDKECNSLAYADEYMHMLNRNVCVKPNEILPAPVLSYPYEAKPQQGYPFDLQFVFTWGTRCNP